MPDPADAPDDLVWWWVPEMGEACCDLYDLPNHATHWQPWAEDSLPPAGPISVPNAEAIRPATQNTNENQ
jgi:hypothetical protein